MQTVVKIWCEVDFGHENLVFLNREAAINWLKEDENVNEILTDEYGEMKTVEDMIERGFVSFTENTVIE